MDVALKVHSEGMTNAAVVDGLMSDAQVRARSLQGVHVQRIILMCDGRTDGEGPKFLFQLDLGDGQGPQGTKVLGCDIKHEDIESAIISATLNADGKSFFGRRPNGESAVRFNNWDREEAFPPGYPRSAMVLMQAGAHMVKLEGGDWTPDTVHFLVQRGIPVCAHLGLTPQTVHALGGYRVQGREPAAAAQLHQDALALQDAGASMVVLEMVPASLATSLTQALPTCHSIGIGAGNGTAGQVLVLHDMLGINLGKNPKFVRNFMSGTDSVLDALSRYVAAVKDGSFPDNNLHAW
jgi:hypothetical protein